jgi:hypothetical protein
MKQKQLKYLKLKNHQALAGLPLLIITLIENFDFKNSKIQNLKNSKLPEPFEGIARCFDKLSNRKAQSSYFKVLSIT